MGVWTRLLGALGRAGLAHNYFYLVVIIFIYDDIVATDVHLSRKLKGVSHVII